MILEKEVRDTDRCGGGGGPRKIYKIEVLRDGISGILRLSKRLVMSHFISNSGGSLPPPSPARCAPGLHVSLSSHFTNTRSTFFRYLKRSVGSEVT